MSQKIQNLSIQKVGRQLGMSVWDSFVLLGLNLIFVMVSLHPVPRPALQIPAWKGFWNLENWLAWVSYLFNRARDSISMGIWLTSLSVGAYLLQRLVSLATRANSVFDFLLIWSFSRWASVNLERAQNSPWTTTAKLLTYFSIGLLTSMTFYGIYPQLENVKEMDAQAQIALVLPAAHVYWTEGSLSRDKLSDEETKHSIEKLLLRKPFIPDLSKSNFFDRQTESTALASLLKDGAIQEARFIVMTGPHQSGKTSLIQHVLADKAVIHVDWRKESVGPFISIHHLVKIVKDCFNAMYIKNLQKLVSVEPPHLFWKRPEKPQYSLVDFKYLLRVITELLEHLKRLRYTHLPIIFIDEVDRIKGLADTQDGHLAEDSLFEWFRTIEKGSLARAIIASSVSFFSQYIAKRCTYQDIYIYNAQ